MTRWEYAVEYVRANISMSEAMKTCNQFGAQGWEIVRISGDTVRGLEFVFKRELSEIPAPDKGKSSGRR